MTLIYHDTSPGPKTHIFIMGVGSFPFLKGGSDALFEGMRSVKDVTSPPNNARALAKFFVEVADDFVPKLGSVELLVSEADGSAAVLEQVDPIFDPRTDTSIEPATGEGVEDALLRWVARCEEEPDNLAVFYGSTHGMQAQEHVLLLEDAGKRVHKPWENMLSVNHLHRILYLKSHKRSIILVDCCRDLLKEGEESLDKFSGRSIGNAKLMDFVEAQAQPDRVVYVLRASPLGAVATGTKNGLGYFTEALFKCLRDECSAAIHRPGIGWSVSPENLRIAVENAGRFGLAFSDDELRPVEQDSHWTGEPFLRVHNTPKFPIRVREAEKQDVGRAHLSIKNPSVPLGVERPPSVVKPEPLCLWVSPRHDAYVAEGEIPAVGSLPAVTLKPTDVMISNQGFDVPLER